MEINVNWAEYPLTVTGDYDPGSDGKYSGPPEDCYEGYGESFEVDTCYFIRGGLPIHINLDSFPINMTDEIFDKVLEEIKVRYEA